MNEKYIKKKLVLKKEIRDRISKILMLIIVFLLGMISTKVNPALKDLINKKVYTESIEFTKNRDLYQKYFGSIFIKEKIKPVISDKLNYKEEKKYENGVLLTVDDNYSVPLIESGIIIYIDNEKIIVEQVDGVKASYSNLKNSNNKLYDYLEKGEIIGSTTKNNLYLSFEKEGVYLDYKKYV